MTWLVIFLTWKDKEDRRRKMIDDGDDCMVVTMTKKIVTKACLSHPLATTKGEKKPFSTDNLG
eukprot:CAMPEP_0171776614 /NCGR_PEP_ID=MMETSP0991-20121206/57262_1 /TAXON_ID=483369 /ORGANISM="non described non described, Strain CCMP2098" /LENGTH=62 /DNA_ID=CAMNT_0012383113 /DNA_START=152 /DNA_END=340 /DNA_ORIENTATION=+